MKKLSKYEYFWIAVWIDRLELLDPANKELVESYDYSSLNMSYSDSNISVGFTSL